MSSGESNNNIYLVGFGQFICVRYLEDTLNCQYNLCVYLFPYPTALVGNACLVRCGLPSQREKWGHHVCFIRHWDPERNRNQQSPASLKAATSNPRDGFPNKSFSSSDIPNCESVSAPPSPNAGQKAAIISPQSPTVAAHISVSAWIILERVSLLFINLAATFNRFPSEELWFWSDWKAATKIDVWASF